MRAVVRDDEADVSLHERIVVRRFGDVDAGRRPRRYTQDAMISDEMRRKLEALSGMDRTHPPAGPPVVASPPAPALGALLSAGEGCARIERAASDFWPDAERVSAALHRLSAGADRFGGRALSEDAASLLRSLPSGVVYMDIESCGFAGNPVFLVGALRIESGGFRLHQFFARHYDEEAAMLRCVAQQLHSGDTLCTFNGKAFDWPFLRDRANVHRVEFPAASLHCDLLHEARRTWGASLPDCRLQTLELHKCGRRRVADIPGAAIPDAYHRYVQTGDDRLMIDVIHHNAVDLVTLAELTVLLLDEAAGTPVGRATGH
jgi:uncharacterized protein YprB with RNaseH-like and TPR domain